MDPATHLFMLGFTGAFMVATLAGLVFAFTTLVRRIP